MNTNNNINISQQNVKSKCDLKCAYNFDYKESNTTAINNGALITLTYDNGSVSPVLFNNQKYNVTSIVLLCPSIHIFNGNSVAAELMIEHTPVSGGPGLAVCIPIISSSNSSTASTILTQVIQSVINNAPNRGEKTNINVTNFNLNNIIPKKPFYTYSDPQNTSFIVFGIINAIPISSSILSSLQQIIKPFPISVTGSNLFYNSKGPNSSGTVGDGIYISCQPTGNSEEETDVTYEKNPTTYDLNFSSIQNNPTALFIFILILQIIAALIFFIFVFFSFNFIYNYFTGDGIKLPNMSKSLS